MMKSMMVKVRIDVDVFALNIDSIEVDGTVQGEQRCIVAMTSGRMHRTDCSKEEMKKRIDTAWGER